MVVEGCQGQLRGAGGGYPLALAGGASVGA